VSNGSLEYAGAEEKSSLGAMHPHRPRVRLWALQGSQPEEEADQRLKQMLATALKQEAGSCAEVRSRALPPRPSASVAAICVAVGRYEQRPRTVEALATAAQGHPKPH